jgi:DNA-binding response OmpR family regulator
MPNIIVPNKEVSGRAQGRVRVLLIVSRPSTSDELVFALANTVPALLVLVHTSDEALEITDAIKPDAFVIESTLEEQSGIDLYSRLQAQPGFATIPTVLIGLLSPEQHHYTAKRKVVNLPYPFEPDDLQSALETLLNIPKAPVRPDTIAVMETKRSFVA